MPSGFELAPVDHFPAGRPLARGTAGPWWRDYRRQSAGLGLLVAACFVVFW